MAEDSVLNSSFIPKVLFILEQDHLQLIDIHNKRKRVELLEKLIGSTPMNKTQFNSTLLTGEMRKKFGDIIEMSTHTWTSKLIPEYLEQIPLKLKELKSSIKEHEQQISTSTKECENSQNYVFDLQNQLTILDSDIENMTKKKTEYENKMITIEQFEILLKSKQNISETINQQHADSQKKYCLDLHHQLEETKNNWDKLKSKYLSAESLLRSLVLNQQTHQKVLKELKEGSNSLVSREIQMTKCNIEN